MHQIHSFAHILSSSSTRVCIVKIDSDVIYVLFLRKPVTMQPMLTRKYEVSIRATSKYLFKAQYKATTPRCFLPPQIYIHKLPPPKLTCQGREADERQTEHQIKIKHLAHFEAFVWNMQKLRKYVHLHLKNVLIEIRKSFR